MNLPPPISQNAIHKRWRGKLIVGLIAGCIVILFIACYMIFQFISSLGITKGQDNLFGDQNLKTAVALIELHKVRYGKYPDALSELKFTGQWDQNALLSVSYFPNANRTGYYIEVQRGWIGKPSLQIPDEFWRGTGYSSSLKPKNK